MRVLSLFSNVTPEKYSFSSMGSLLTCYQVGPLITYLLSAGWVSSLQIFLAILQVSAVDLLSRYLFYYHLINEYYKTSI